MTALQVELAHLIALMAPPFQANWSRYCWAKANVLAESNPQDYADLPRLLKEAMFKSAPGEKAPDPSSTPPPSPQRTGGA